jgi:hypothetical protein
MTGAWWRARRPAINTKRGRREPAAMTFGCYGHGLDGTPDLDVPDEGSAPADVWLLVDEARLTCTSGMATTGSRPPGSA